MSSRKSTRLVNQNIHEVNKINQPASNAKKRKPSASLSKDKSHVKRRATHVVINKVSGDDSLLSLPRELLDMILKELEGDLPTISRLGRVSKAYYSLMMPLLYNRVAVAAMFHAHIARIIRTLEPILSIAQKRQLRKEGKYKGQQERYWTRFDPNMTPHCAAHVRQMVVGVANPGRKHNYIVHRYIEEAFKNTKNLEIVEAYFLTESMAESLASLPNLKALRLLHTELDVDALEPLAVIKNLKHLNIEHSGYNRGNVVQSILLNSASTLESLVIMSSTYGRWFLEGWMEVVSINKNLASQEHILPNLKTFTLSGFLFEGSFIEPLQTTVDFMGLTELNLGRIGHDQQLLFDHLTALAKSNQDSGKSINIRNLWVDMGDCSTYHGDEKSKGYFEAKCRFISSFDTLTSLEIHDYNQYSASIAVNPGLSDDLLKAVLKHKKLKSLKITYRGIIGGCKIPYLDISTIATIIDNLPHLQEIEFAPEEVNIKQIGNILSRATNLKSITCFPYESWGAFPRPEDPGMNILIGVVNAFLSQASVSDDEKFIWEQHYKLKRVCVSHKLWDIASGFGEPTKVKKKAEKKTLKKERAGKVENQGREVYYKDIARSFQIHVGYDNEFGWVRKVARDLIG